jgi:endogenous inhibitor of DNA gyrase (YacG/DUF329 family)
MVDLGAWANEEYRVPGPSAVELVDNSAEPENGE